VGLAEVAEGAGLGKASLFHHFPTKAHLYLAVMARVLTTLELDLLRSLAEGGPPTERLDRWIDTTIDTLVAHPTYARLLLRVLVEETELPAGLDEGRRANEAMRRIATAAIRLLREGMDTGEFAPASAGHTLQFLIGAIVHPLATGRFGEELTGGSLFEPDQVQRRKATLRKLVHSGIVR
jgi:TetR/AcrR family transcriptional regulator